MVRGVRPASRSGRCSAARSTGTPGAGQQQPARPVPPRAGERAGRPRRARHCRRRARAACRSSGGWRRAWWCRSRGPVGGFVRPECRTPRPRARAAIAGRGRAVLPAQGVLGDVVVVQPVVGISSCISASARAASVPGRRAMCSWHLSAVSLLRGRCTPAWHHCAWPAGRSARSAGCCQSSCCPR